MDTKEIIKGVLGELMTAMKDREGARIHMMIAKKNGKPMGEDQETDQLEEGKEVEEEHESTLEELIKKATGGMEPTVEEGEEDIAEDHIDEDPEYYDKLKMIEGDGEGKMKKLRMRLGK